MEVWTTAAAGGAMDLREDDVFGERVTGVERSHGGGLRCR